MVQCVQRNMLKLLVVFLISKLDISLSEVTGIFHIGCYRKSSEKNFSDAHLVTQYFWHNCVNNCNGDYVGINLHDCFCGAEVDQTFIATDNANCEICPLHRLMIVGITRYCGGSDTMSLYKLLPTKASETAILIATDNVKMWMFENHIMSVMDPTLITLLKFNIRFIAYHHVDWTIYFVSGSKIFKIEFYDSLGEYSRTPTVFLETNCNIVTDLAIDWVNYVIFWVCKNTGNIHWKNKITGVSSYVHAHSEGIKDITIEPYRKFLFYLNATGLVKYDFASSKTDILENHNFTQLLHATADVQEERIYMIGTNAEGLSNYLVSTDYNFTSFKVLLSGAELSYPFGLEAVNGTVVWGNTIHTWNTWTHGTHVIHRNNHHTLYKIQVSSSEPVKVRTVFTQSEEIKDFKMYTYDAKYPSTKYLCEIKNCSHSCVRVSSTQVNCSCPGTMFLTHDSRTCVKPSPITTELVNVLGVVYPIIISVITVMILAGLLICLAVRQKNVNRILPPVQYNRSEDLRVTKICR